MNVQNNNPLWDQVPQDDETGHYQDPLTYQTMLRPVADTCGHIFDEASAARIESKHQWINGQYREVKACPMCRQPDFNPQRISFPEGYDGPSAPPAPTVNQARGTQRVFNNYHNPGRSRVNPPPNRPASNFRVSVINGRVSSSANGGPLKTAARIARLVFGLVSLVALVATVAFIGKSVGARLTGRQVRPYAIKALQAWVVFFLARTLGSVSYKVAERA